MATIPHLQTHGATRCERVTLNQEKRLLERAIAELKCHETPSLTISGSAQLNGSLDIRALDRALDHLLDRHSGLRTVFLLNASLSTSEVRDRLEWFAATRMVVPGLFTQAANPNSPTPQIHRLRVDTPSEVNAVVQQIVDRASAMTFGYADVKLRLAVISLGPKHHTIVLTVDHLVCDGLSFRILLSDLVALYRTYSTGQPTDLPRLTIDHTVFVRWQLDELASGGFEAHGRYWRREWLECEPHQISYAEMPGASNIRWTPSKARSFVEVGYDDDTSRAASELARATDTTIYVVWLSALALSIRRWISKSRFAVWIKLANRFSPGTLNTVGWFSNCHLIGIDLSTYETFDAVLAHVGDVVAKAVEHEQLPFALVSRAVRRPLRFSDVRITFDLLRGTNDERAERRVMLSPVVIHPTCGEEALEFYVSDNHANGVIGVRAPADRFRRETLMTILAVMKDAVRQDVTSTQTMSGGLVSGLQRCGRKAQV